MPLPGRPWRTVPAAAIVVAAVLGVVLAPALSHAMPVDPALIEASKRDPAVRAAIQKDLTGVKPAGLDEPTTRLDLNRLRSPWLVSRAGIGSPLGSIGQVQVTGVFKQLVLLVDFSDIPAKVPASFYDEFLFGDVVGPTSVRGYFREISAGALDIQSVAADLPSARGWIRLPQTSAYYAGIDDGTETYPRNGQKMAEDALAAAEALGVDFSQYDNNHDGYLDGVIVLHAGVGEEASAATGTIHSHKWSVATRARYDGVYTRDYTTMPEFYARPYDSTTGVFVHELAHAFGADDLYDYDYSSYGVGKWSLMANGSWNGASGSLPARPDPYNMALMGLATPFTATTTATVSIRSATYSSTGDVFKVQKAGAVNSNEYFLVENRQKTGTDAGLPAAGLLIWHVDTTIANNDNELRYKVDLEEAHGGTQHLATAETAKRNYGDAGDPFPGTGSKAWFSDLTDPSSKYYDGTGRVTISGISSSSLSMAATIACSRPSSDTLPPVTTSDVRDTYDTSATITLTATDTASGVASTNWLLDTVPGVGPIVSSATYGSHTLKFWSTDFAGNVEASTTASFFIRDVTTPTISCNATETYVASATIRVTATDEVGGSGIGSITKRIDSQAPQTALNSSSWTGVYVTPGVHTLAFSTTDKAGNSSGTSTVTFTIVPAPLPELPVLSVPASTTVSSVAIAWAPARWATTYELSCGSITWSGVFYSKTVTGLTPGPNTIRIRACNYTGYSDWATATVIYYAPLPASPVLSAPATVWNPSVRAEWNAVAGATGYEYRINGGMIKSASLLSCSASNLGIGANTVEVRSCNYTGTSAWATATVTFTLPPLPAAPVISAPANTTVTTAGISWTEVEYATQYECRYGARLASGAMTSWVVTDLVPGPNIVTVRASDYSGASAWATVTITYLPPVPPAPFLPSLGTVSVPSKSLSWTAVSGATSYDYRVNGGGISNTVAAACSVSGLAPGPNAVEVRSRNSFGGGEWAAATVTYLPPIPAPPTLPSLGTVTVASKSFSWTAVSGATSYGVRVNGGTVATAAVAATTVSGLVPGPNTVEVRSANYTGASGWASAALTYLPPIPDAPALPALGIVNVPSKSFTWPVVAGATSYEYRVNAGAITTTAVEAGEVSGLVPGANTIQARSRNHTGASAWASDIVTYLPPIPDAPELSEIGTTTVSGTSATWARVSGADTYDYRLNGGTIVNTHAVSVTIAGLVPGTNVIEVRSRNYTGASGWSAVGVTYEPPVPDSPVPGAPEPAAVGSTVDTTVEVTWSPVEFAAVYQCELNGVAHPETIAEADLFLGGLLGGENVVRVRAFNADGDPGAWSEPIKVVVLAGCLVSARVPTAVLAYGGTGAVIAVSAEDLHGAAAPDRRIVLQYSYDKVRWSELTSLTTDATGCASFAYKPARTVWVRPVAVADLRNAAATGAAVRIAVAPSLGRPAVAATVTHSRTFTISGYLKPRHAKNAHDVTIKLYRLVKTTWKYYKTVTCTNANYSSYTRFSVRTSVPYSGSWRAYAYYKGSTSFVAATSAYTQFKAR